MSRGLLLLLSLLLMAAAPSGWELVGSASHAYRVSVDRDTVKSGRKSVRLSSTRQSDGFGTLMQTIQADRYRGERIQLTAWVRAEAVESWAGLWMRIDDDAGQTLTFDNMQDRSIRGTADWQQVSVVLDVAEEAEVISFGMLLSGEGTVWVDGITFEPVGRDVPLTGRAARRPAGPQNLSFD